MPQHLCIVVNVGKSRNGRPRFWCTAHGANATGRYGVRLPQCEKAHLCVDESKCFDVDEQNFSGGIGVWGAVSPIYNSSPWDDESGIHVHARNKPNDEEKVLDKTFPAVKIKYKKDLFENKILIITQEAAIYYYVSKYLRRNISHLCCRYCGEVHLDADYFAVHPHRRHVCNSCGRYFNDSSKSVSNPVALLLELRKDTDDKRTLRRATRVLDICQRDYPGGMKIWASNPAILWTLARPEDEGLHVHVYQYGSDICDEDETFDKVIIDGCQINETMSRQLMAQQVLSYLKNKVVSIKCPECGGAHFDDGEKGFYPHKNHVCEHCGATFLTPGKRRLVVSNPLVSVLSDLRQAASQTS